MNETEVIQLTKYAGGPLCVTPNDGDEAFKAIHAAIESGKRVDVSFEGVEDLTSAFLNAAVGQLYGLGYPESKLSELLLPINASQQDLAMLKRVVERAKEYFKDRKPFEEAAKQALGEDDE